MTITTYDSEFRICIDSDESYLCNNRLIETLKITGFEDASFDDKVELFSQTQRMKVFWIEKFPVTDRVLQSVKLCGFLQFISIDSCGEVFSFQVIKQILEGCCKLQKIYLGGCNHFDSECLVDILTTNKHSLHFIGLTDHHDVCPLALCRVVAINVNMLGLYISNCKSVAVTSSDYEAVESVLKKLNNKIMLCSKVFMMYH
jgi:hypothetical protein